MKAIEIFLFKSFNKYFPALLTFLCGLFVIEGVATKSQISHDSVINVEEVEYGKDDHENGEDVNNLFRNCDIA